jgi:hypothetical protein
MIQIRHPDTEEILEEYDEADKPLAELIQEALNRRLLEYIGRAPNGKALYERTATGLHGAN